MFGLSEILAFGGAGYSLATGIVHGRKLNRILDNVKDNSDKIQKLSNQIFLRLDESALSNLNGDNKISKLRETRDFLNPIPDLFGGKILSSAVITTSEKLQKSFKASPWKVLDLVKPVNISEKHPNSDMIPILFYEKNIAYVGWQMKGVLPLLFDFELNPNSGLWQNSTNFFSTNESYLGQNIGIETKSEKFHVLASKGQKLPFTYKETFSTAVDNQPSIEINILEGNYLDIRKNKTIGRFHLDNIPPSLKGVPQIEISFNIDENALITISAKDLGTDNIRISKFPGVLSKEKQNFNQVIIECAKCSTRLRIPTKTHIRFKCPKCNFQYEVKDSIIQ